MTLATKLPRKWCRYDYRNQPASVSGDNFTIGPAAYAQNKYTIRTNGVDGYKSRACRLASAITRGNYTKRAKGYQASAAQAEKFMQLYAAGWDASIFGQLEAPAAQA